MVKIPEGVARYITFSPAAGGASNHCYATIQVVDAYGNAVAESFMFWVWISDVATGIGLSAKSDAMAVITDGADFIAIAYTNGNLIFVQTDATGKYVLDITEATAGDRDFYIAATIPGGPNAGRIAVSRVLTTADFTA